MIKNKILYLLLIAVFVNATDSISTYTNLVTVTRQASYTSEFIITPRDPIKHINDIDLNTTAGKELALAIIATILELVRTRNDPDFSIHITVKAERLVVIVNLYPGSDERRGTPCNFCDRKKFKGDIIAENKDVIAMEKSTPARSPINFLIIPKKHVVNYKDLHFTPEIFIAQLAMAQELSKKLTHPTVDLYINNGINASQSVFHSHMHFHTPAGWK
jgi:diadenosine tetraphosphate (Ap4A) HIT family hydrolase